MALTADRNTIRRDGKDRVVPVAASTKLFGGAIGCRDANGNAVPGAISSTLAALGRVEQQVDNSAGGAGDQTVRIATGVFQYDNSAASGAVTLAQVGKDCYIVDDHSVTAANAANNKSVAGTVFDVDASGVWVKFN